MSIRFIGVENSPFSHKYNIKSNMSEYPGQSPQLLYQHQKKNKYRQQLDRQVEENRKRKEIIRKKEYDEDRRREEEFYRSLDKSRKKQNNENLEEDAEMFNKSRRLMKVGKRKINFDSPSFNNKIIQKKHDIQLNIPSSVKGQSYYQSFQRSQFNDKEARIKEFQDELDWKLGEVYKHLQRSKYEMDTEKELQNFRQRLKTDIYPVGEEQEDDYDYFLPNSRYRRSKPVYRPHRISTEWNN